MALNLIGLNSATITPIGGGKLFLKQVNSDGTDLSTPDTWHAAFIIKDSELDDNNPFKEFPDERGDVYYAPTSRKVSLTGTTYQRDVGSLTFSPTDAYGNYYALFKQMSDTKVNSLYQYLFAPIIQVEPVLKFKTLGNDIPFKFVFNNNEAAVTCTSWSGVTGMRSVTIVSGAPSITCPANGYYTWYTALS